MSVQYQTEVFWDSTLIDLEYTDINNPLVKGLVIQAIKITAGAPAATVGRFIPGAIIQNAATGINYQNTGTTASPVWAVIDVSSGGLPALASGAIWVGSAGAVATAQILSGDVTVSNLGVTTVGAINLEAATVTNIANTEIFIGTGAGTGAFAALSGDVTMTNGGVVTVTGATGLFEAGGGITNAGGTLYVGFAPSASLPQALSGPGAADIVTYQTQFTSTGAGDALTLAVATRIGHEKKITYVAEAAGGDTGVITPAAVIGYATVTLNAIGDYVVFFWTGAAWAIKEYYGATVA